MVKLVHYKMEGVSSVIGILYADTKTEVGSGMTVEGLGDLTLAAGTIAMCADNTKLTLDSNNNWITDGQAVVWSNIYNKVRNIEAYVEVLARGETVQDWDAVKLLLDDGLAPHEYPVGSQLVETWFKTSETSYPAPWDVVHYDENGNMFLKWHYATPDAIAFDAPEAIYCFDGTEEAGVEYYIEISLAYGTGWVAEAGIAFTLAVAPDEGDQLVLSTATNNATDPTNGITWNVYAKGSTISKDSGTTSNSKTGTKLGETSSLGVGYTNGHVNAPQRVVYGYNRWSQSAIRQWCNSAAAAGSWWTPQNDWDRPPAQAATVRGFLAGCSQGFLDILEPVNVVTAINTVEGSADTTETTQDLIFLPSLEEMYIQPQLADVEGEDWDYYKALALEASLPGKFQQYGTYPILKTFAVENHSSNVYVRLRSAYRGSASYTWVVYSSGHVGSSYAYNAVRCCPACKIVKS